MKHTFLVLVAGCGALTAATFAGSHADDAPHLVQVAPARARAPVAIVTSPDGAQDVTSCVAVVCCDPACDPKQVRAISAAPSVVRVGTNGNGQVLVCSGGGTLTVACSNGQDSGRGAVGSTSVVSSHGSSPVAVGQGRGGAVAIAGPIAQGASARGSTCQVSSGQAPVVCTQGSPSLCAVGQGASAGGTAHGYGNTLSLVQEPPHATGTPGTPPAATADLGHLVQALRATEGSMIVQGSACDDSNGVTQLAPPKMEMSDVPESADVLEFPDAPAMAGADDDDDDDSLGSDEWKRDVESALEAARAGVAGADEDAREAIEEARAEMESAQSGSMSEEAMRDYRSALEKAEVEMRTAMESAAQAQDQAQTRARSGGTWGELSQAQADEARAQDEHKRITVRAKQEAQRARADADRAHADAQGLLQERKLDAEQRGRAARSGENGLEARVQALENMARGRGHQVSGQGSLEDRVRELERAMRGQAEGDAKASKVRAFYGVAPDAKVSPPQFKLMTPTAPKAPRAPTSVYRLATPATPGVPPTPPTGAAPKVRVERSGRTPGMGGGGGGGGGSMGRMDEQTRKDLERAMGDLRKEADRLRQEMVKLRAEIEELPKK
jgi:hypothetical protein